FRSITFTAAASGGSGSYQYYFTYRTPAGSWVAARAHSSTPTWAWNTTGQAAGVYTIQVWARNAGSAASVEAYKSLSYTLTTGTGPVSSVTLTPNLSSPRAVGTVVTFTAAASGGSGSYQYYFTYRTPAGSWVAARAYSSTPTWAWNTTGLATGVYTIQVWARNAGSAASYEAYKSLSYTLQSNSGSIVGAWNLLYDWYCDGTVGNAIWYLAADHTCTSSSGGVCTWNLVGSQFTLIYTNGTTYSGQFSPGSMSGTMMDYYGTSGCWSATYGGPLQLGLLPPIAEGAGSPDDEDSPERPGKKTSQ
ncbi:MAG: hypothetical protein ACYC7J_20920, partial [Syntrophales bacterium]